MILTKNYDNFIKLRNRDWLLNKAKCYLSAFCFKRYEARINLYGYE